MQPVKKTNGVPASATARFRRVTAVVSPGLWSGPRSRLEIDKCMMSFLDQSVSTDVKAAAACADASHTDKAGKSSLPAQKISGNCNFYSENLAISRPRGWDCRG